MQISKARIGVNIFLALSVAVGVAMMLLGTGGVLLSNNVEGFKYFTVLSNVFEGIASLLWLFSAAVRKEEKRWAALLKYAAAVCVGLTFVTVMVFLGPLYGYHTMFLNANLFFHLIIPLAAMAEFVLMNRRQIRLRFNLAAAVPTLLYGTAYLINILVQTPTDNPYEHDFYGFVLWGLPVGIGIFACICLASFLIGLALRGLNDFYQKSRRSI